MHATDPSYVADHSTYFPRLLLVGWPHRENYFTAARLHLWTDRDITEAEALFTDGQLCPYNQLMVDYDLPRANSYSTDNY